MCCCQKDKGFLPVINLVGESQQKIDAVGFYDISFENLGDVDAEIADFMTIPPGECKHFGVQGYPCTVDLNVKFSSDSGEKQLRVVKYKLVPYKPEECPPVDLDRASATSIP